MLAFYRVRNDPKLIWCEICCCEINTQAVLETHRQSEKHKKKEFAQAEIFKLRDEYLALINGKNNPKEETSEPDSSSNPKEEETATAITTTANDSSIPNSEQPL
jgi:hypothetical protein